MPVEPNDVAQFADVPRWPFLTLLALGFLIAAGGHLFASKTAILTGLAMVFFATVILPIFVVLTY